MTDGNYPAFPSGQYVDRNGDIKSSIDGCTKRELFTAIAMHAILSATGKVSMENGLFVNEANLSVAVAEATIKALNK